MTIIWNVEIRSFFKLCEPHKMSSVLQKCVDSWNKKEKKLKYIYSKKMMLCYIQPLEMVEIKDDNRNIKKKKRKRNPTNYDELPQRSHQHKVEVLDSINLAVHWTSLQCCSQLQQALLKWKDELLHDDISTDESIRDQDGEGLGIRIKQD